MQDVASCDLLPSLHAFSFSIYTVQYVVDSWLEILGGELSLLMFYSKKYEEHACCKDFDDTNLIVIFQVVAAHKFNS